MHPLNKKCSESGEGLSINKPEIGFVGKLLNNFLTTIFYQIVPFQQQICNKLLPKGTTSWKPIERQVAKF